MEKRKLKRLTNRVLSFVLSTLLIVGMLPAVAFAKTGETPITGFSAADNSFIEGDLEWGDQYNLDATNYTVTTDDGESYTGPMWEVDSWLCNKYPGIELDEHINWEKTEDPSQGSAGESFKIVYYLDGFEAEWNLHIVENPISKIIPYDVIRVEGDTYKADGYDGMDGEWHQGEWDKYNFYPKFHIELKNGAVYDSYDDDGWEITGWLREQTGIEFTLQYNDDIVQDPPNGCGVGEYNIPYKLGPIDSTYKGIVIENPIQKLEFKEIKRIEGDTFEEDGYPDEEGWQDVRWQKYDFSPDIKVTLRNGETYENSDCWDVYDWIKEHTGLDELEFRWDDNTCQNPPTGIGVGEYSVHYRIGGFEGDYKASVVKNPIVSMTNDPMTIVKFEGSKNERDGYWDEEAQQWVPDYKWDAYDISPHNMTVKTDDGDSIENADWWDCRRWLEEKYDLPFRDHSDGDTQSPTNGWEVGDYPITFYLGSSSMSYTVSIVENPIISVSAEGQRRLEGEKDRRDRYWDEEKQEDVYEEWYAYPGWPSSIKVVTTKGTFEGDPNDVRRELAAALGKTEDEINRMGFGDTGDDQSPTNPWGIGTHHNSFNVCGVYADYDIEIVESPVKSVTVDDLVVFQGNTRTEHGYWGPDGEWIEKDWERYDVWPSRIVVEMKDGKTFEGDPNYVYNEVRNLVGYEFGFGDRDSDQSPDNLWSVGDHESKFLFGGQWTTYTVSVVADPIVSVTVNKPVYMTEGDTYTADGYPDDKGEWIECEWQKYGYMPYDITVKVRKSALKKGTKTTFTGDSWVVRAQVAEALGINEDDIRMECHDDQSPDNLWGAGEHDSVYNFAGKTSGFKVIIVPFPIAKVSVDKVYIDWNAPLADLNMYHDFETDKDYYEINPSFKGYEVRPEKITVTFKNGSKKTGNPGDLQEEVMQMIMDETGLDGEGAFFPVYCMTDQTPQKSWAVGNHKALLRFGSLSAEFQVEVLGEFGTYTGLYYDKSNNRYIYLEKGVMKTGFTGIVNGKIASAIDRKNPQKSTYIKGSEAKWYVKNGVIQKQYTGLVNYSGKWIYVNKGIWDTSHSGFVSYGGGKFYIANGVKVNKSGLINDPKNTEYWYFCSAGQVQLNYSGLTQYDGQWFYISNGRLDTTFSGYVSYDGGLFFVAVGRIVREASGLAQDPHSPNDWYFLAEGQAQTQYTGLAFYDNAWFYVIRGKLATDYTGYVEYDGERFYVVNGMVK